MKTIKPKEFISQVLIDELSEIHLKHPYISFAIMAIGIEFLGKCLNNKRDWNFTKKGQSKKDFENAIKRLGSLEKYRPYLESHKLYNALRNGFAHSFVPKGTITLSSKKEMPHMKVHEGKLNLKCEDFFIDFKGACSEVINMSFPETNKMNKPLLIVPDNPDNTPIPNSNLNTVIIPNLDTITSDTTAVTGTATTAVFTQK